ncbi:hypothetical protein CCMA1212_008473 [Trichoderma ghanense]|uniref:Uncharacterized protein n=1 Tax=Trichoderma ghanense TaxID=65468 RepID=A0ABY2GUI2_9HYPO
MFVAARFRPAQPANRVGLLCWHWTRYNEPHAIRTRGKVTAAGHDPRIDGPGLAT